MREESNSVRIPLVACPFFMPVALVEETGWIHAPRLPLGARYRGFCKSRPDEQFEAQGDLCNCGYARAACDRFPMDAEADAVRFSVIANDPLKLVYIYERGHAPSTFGVFEYPAGPGGDAILAAQARAFAEALDQGFRPARSFTSASGQQG